MKSLGGYDSVRYIVVCRTKYIELLIIVVYLKASSYKYNIDTRFYFKIYSLYVPTPRRKKNIIDFWCRYS